MKHPWSYRFSPIDAFIGWMLISVIQPAFSLPAFKGAEGFGADTHHARGKPVCYVTQLGDTENKQHLIPGTFRYCLRKAREQQGAYILFDVSGIIKLKHKAIVPSHVYIAGQTSPAGIGFSGNVIEIENASNVVIRHIRHRGAALKGDAFNIENSSNVILDHVSVSFFRDGAVDIVKNSHNITVQWSHMGDAIKSGDDTEPYHGQPNLLRTHVDKISFHHNLYTHAHSRAPLAQYTCKPGMLIEFSNNLIYNFGKYPSRFDTPNGRANIIGNYYIPGKNSHGDSHTGPQPPITGSRNFSVFVKDNIVESGIGHDARKMSGRGQNIWRGAPAKYTGTRTSDEIDDAMIIGTMQGQLGPQPGVFNLLASRIEDIPPISLQRARENTHLVLSQFGALPRDNTDRRLVEEVNFRQGQWRFIKPNDNNVYAGIPPRDSDRDGIPDSFESTFEQDLKPTAHDLSPTYDNLEVYLDIRAAELLKQAVPVKFLARQPEINKQTTPQK